MRQRMSNSRGSGIRPNDHIRELSKSVMSNGSQLLWRVYKSFLEGPAKVLLPEHTRDALLQLFCDLRTNVPKDKKWAYQHGRALKPHTFPGWIALAAFITALLALSSLASSALLVSSLGIAAAITTLASILGVVMGFWALVISGCLFVSTFLLAGTAAFLAAGYLGIAVLLKMARIGQETLSYISESQGGAAQKTWTRSPSRPVTTEESIQMQQIRSTPNNASQHSSIPDTSSPKTLALPQGGNASGTSDSKNSSASTTSPTIADPLQKKGKRTFAQLQQDLQPGHPMNGSKDRSKNSEAPFAASLPQSAGSAPADLSPGRAEAHHNFTEIQKAAKGLTDSDLKPEGGPSVPGKFAEAVHPEAVSRLEVNGLS